MSKRSVPTHNALRSHQFSRRNVPTTCATNKNSVSRIARPTSSIRPTNISSAPWPSLSEARARVLGIQTKLHRWTSEDEGRRSDDLSNLVADPAFLVVAWNRVRGNKGARTAGIDGETARYVEARGVEAFLDDLRGQPKARTFLPLPVRERTIPKPGTRKRRRLGIPTVRDRVVQASLKLVLEPIFEADLHPSSYGFRPNRRAQDAIAEIHYLGSRSSSGCWRRTSRRASTRSAMRP